MVLMLYFQFYLLYDFARFVKASINVSGGPWLSEWGSGDIKSFNESVVDEIFCGSTVH